MSPDRPSVDLVHPTQVTGPFHRPGQLYEEKYDGRRMLASKHGGQVRLVSQAGRDHTRRFPLILDGEVCIFDEPLVSRFEWLSARATAESATPPIFMAFDCLWADGRDLRAQPLSACR